MKGSPCCAISNVKVTVRIHEKKDNIIKNVFTKYFSNLLLKMYECILYTFRLPCSFSIEPDVSEKNRKTLDDFVKEDTIYEALVHYSAKGKCLRECKSKFLPPQLRQPDILLLKAFKKRVPYSYLHFSYYQV